jgi:predicted Zn-dependent peptidase
MLNRTLPPPIHDAVDFSFTLPSCEKQMLRNQIPLYWLSAGTQDVVQVDWVFKAGLWEESQPALAQAVAALLKNGTAKRSSAEINESLEFYGATLKINANNDYTFVSLYTLTKHLPVLLPVVRELMLEATFPEEELQIYVQNSLQRLSVNLQKSDFVANRHIDAFLFGRQHPYGRFTEAADIGALHSENLRDFHRKYYSANNCTIFMAGNIDEQHVALVTQHFGSDHWGSGDAVPIPEFTIQPESKLRHRILLDEKNVQGSIRIARHFPGRRDPDFTPMIVVNTLFGGYFGSRLMANIREEKGYTYGIHSHIYNYKNSSDLLIATEAGKAVCEQTIEEVYKEMDRLCEESVDAAELLLVKNYLLGNLLGDLEGPFSIMQRWKSMILNDMPEGSFDDNIRIYKTISSEQIRTLAQRYLKKEDYYELVVS